MDIRPARRRVAVFARIVGLEMILRLASRLLPVMTRKAIGRDARVIKAG